MVSDEAEVEEAKKEPGAAFLRKPVTPPLVSRKVREALDAQPWRFTAARIRGKQ